MRKKSPCIFSTKSKLLNIINHIFGLCCAIIKDQNLILVNRSECCSGVITRIGPRTGKGSTIDLAICNQFMKENILEMKVDEEEN